MSKELLKYAWPAVADYEKEVGFEVSDAFKVAWDMARTRLSNESTSQAEEDLKRLEKRCPLRCDFSQAMKDLKREPPMTGREMYQRGYAAAERDLKREPLSDEVICEILLKKEWFGFVELVRNIEKMHGIGGEE